MDVKTLADQMERFRIRFGERAFDEEFVRLIKRELLNMANDDMIRMTDIMIGTRASTRPPTIVDFREARLNLERNKFNREVQGAVVGWDSTALPRSLEKMWPGARTALEAMEMELLRRQIARANGT